MSRFRLAVMSAFSAMAVASVWLKASSALPVAEIAPALAESSQGLAALVTVLVRITSRALTTAAGMLSLVSPARVGMDWPIKVLTFAETSLTAAFRPIAIAPASTPSR